MEGLEGPTEELEEAEEEEDDDEGGTDNDGCFSTRLRLGSVPVALGRGGVLGVRSEEIRGGFAPWSLSTRLYLKASIASVCSPVSASRRLALVPSFPAFPAFPAFVSAVFPTAAVASVLVAATGVEY